MKCLSIMQPWAHAILHLGKDVENRSWGTGFAGRILIHASKRVKTTFPAPRGWRAPVRLPSPDDERLIRGAIIGSVEIVGCVRDSRSPWAFPDYWHLILARPKIFSRPIPYAGQTYLFHVDTLLGP
jgi:hypothetical protein